MKTMNDEIYFAAVGDVHGDMHAMVRLVYQACFRAGKIEPAFVLQVGDFEPHRHEEDLAGMAAPAKYRVLGDFPDFHEGRATFPWPVYFIGGNHEPYGFLDTMPEGGECVPNCSYLGRVGRMEIEGLRIVGLSGIFHPEKTFARRPDIADISKVSNKEYIYFIEEEVQRAMEFENADILLVHEWPAGVIAPEDESRFEKQRRSMRYDDVGNEYARILMETLRPGLVLAGHMHMSYANRIRAGAVDISFRAMANTAAGLDAVALYRVRNVDGEREIQEIETPWPYD